MKSPAPCENTFFVLILMSTLLFFSACKKETAASSPVTASGSGDLAGLILEDIPGSPVKYARQINSAGVLEIEGFVKDNKKTGMWMQFNAQGDVGLINNYVDGLLEGVALRMTYRNQVDLKSTYRKGKLNGPWVTYKYGKVTEERNYIDGLLDGTAKVYDDRTFKLKQEAQYKNGVQDGYFRYYDEDGNITLEYTYKNGEKLSGGMKK